MSDAADEAAELAACETAHLLAGLHRQQDMRTTLTAGGARACRTCGDDIPAERLAANPAAGRCVDCQQDWERGR